MEVIISSKSDLVTFNLVAKLLLQNFEIEFISKTNGLDQSYYDFIFQKNKYTLHREHFIGISLLYEIENEDIVQLVKKIKNNILE
ncbi:DUF3630 family protein [Leptospira kanakyensis]